MNYKRDLSELAVSMRAKGYDVSVGDCDDLLKRMLKVDWNNPPPDVDQKLKDFRVLYVKLVY